MTKDYKKEQSILNKWFHLRAATQFANSFGISGSSAACFTPSTLTSSSTGTSFGVLVILEGIKPAITHMLPNALQWLWGCKSSWRSRVGQHGLWGWGARDGAAELGVG